MNRFAEATAYIAQEIGRTAASKNSISKAVRDNMGKFGFGMETYSDLYGAVCTKLAEDRMVSFR